MNFYFLQMINQIKGSYEIVIKIVLLAWKLVIAGRCVLSKDWWADREMFETADSGAKCNKDEPGVRGG